MTAIEPSDSPGGPSTPAWPDHPVPLDECRFDVQILRGEDRVAVGSEPVTNDDFCDALYETWLECRLRKGMLESSPDELPLRILPLSEEGNEPVCRGFALTLPGSGAEPVHGVFSMLSLHFAARRGITRLVESGVLPKEEAHHYQLVFSRRADSSPSPADDPPGVDLIRRKPALHFLQVPLPGLLEDSAPVSVPAGFPGQKDPFPVFFTEEVYRNAEVFSRKGTLENPFHESGCILAGSLCSCPDTGEFFLVVYDAFEVADGDQSLVSLAYTGKDWARFETIVRARQKAHPHYRLLGQSHGHNFLPNDGKCCEACPTREYCDLTNLFASTNDQEWSRAVFSQQPWHLCQIFGLSARGDKIDGLFTLHDGRPAIREFRLLPGFDPALYPSISSES